MAIYYTFDTAVEEFIHWCAKCEHYGMDPKHIILAAKKEYSYLFGEEDDAEEEK